MLVREPAADGGTLTRTVQVDAQVGSTTVNPAWNYVYAAGHGCLDPQQFRPFSGAVYTRGNLCLNNSSSVTGSPVYVEGHIDLNGSSAASAAQHVPIAELNVASGCRYVGASPYIFPCTAAQHVYATSQDQITAGVKKPPVDLSYWYTNAKPCPMTACNARGTPFPGGFDATPRSTAAAPT